MKRDFLRLTDLSRPECEQLFASAIEIKQTLRSGKPRLLLDRKTLAMIFEKPSLRTRISFETGMFQLGGHGIYFDVRLGERESIPDVARNLARMVDAIVARTFSHAALAQLAEHSRVPVINGLTDMHHPCQVLADLLTLVERRRTLDGLRVAFIGDGNNIVHSWIDAATLFPFTFALACPPGYEPDATVVAEARAAGADVEITHEVSDAAHNADVVYTDVWTSMGQEGEEERRRRDFAGYQVNEGVMRCAAKNAVVMHCLPAHRGDEITDAVLESPQSVVFDEAENRLHVQKALLVWLVRGGA
jgi:ornithine carbamoyltransferase